MNPIDVTLDGQITVTAADCNPTDRWNGFLRPRFDHETADKIMTFMNAEAEVFGEDASTFRWETQDGVEVIAETQDGETSYLAPDADGLYPLGAGAWVWTEAETEQ